MSRATCPPYGVSPAGRIARAPPHTRPRLRRGCSAHPTRAPSAPGSRCSRRESHRRSRLRRAGGSRALQSASCAESSSTDSDGRLLSEGSSGGNERSAQTATIRSMTAERQDRGPPHPIRGDRQCESRHGRILGREADHDARLDEVGARGEMEAGALGPGRRGPGSGRNYDFGVTRVSLRDYVLASWIGMIPGTVMYVYLGSLAGDLASIGSGRTSRTPPSGCSAGLGSWPRSRSACT